MYMVIYLQQWHKVEKSQGNNNEGYCFSLVNKATQDAIKHPALNRPVRIINCLYKSDINYFGYTYIWSKLQNLNI